MAPNFICMRRLAGWGAKADYEGDFTVFARREEIGE